MNDLLLAVEPWADLWAASLWRATWQGTIALAVAWTIARTCTFLSPRVVCWIWRLACVKLLVALFWVQGVAIPVLSASAPLATNPQADMRAANRSPIEATPAQTRVIESTSGALSSDAPHRATSAYSILLSVWLLCVFCGVAVTIRQWRSARLLCRSAAPAADLIGRLCRLEAVTLAVRRLPRLAFSSRAEGPLLSGIWRPTIILPEPALATFDETELRLMLAHELAHLKRHDLLWNWLPTITTWLFFFHPLVWLMTRGWSEAQEAACDELLIQNKVANTSAYGRLLVRLAARWPQELNAGLTTAGVLGAYRNLEKRISQMTHVKPFSRGRLLGLACILTLVAAPGIIPWRLVAQQSGRSVARAAEPAAPENAARLPGRIYARAGLETKSATGETETYSGAIAIDPNTGSWEKIGEIGHGLRVSPNGERIAYCQARTPTDPQSKSRIYDVFVAGARNQQPAKIADNANLPIWSPDSQRLLYNVGAMSEDTGWRGAPWTIELATLKTQKLPIPETDEVDDWSRDGDWLVTVSDRHPPFGSGYQLYVMHPDGSGERRLTDDKGLNCYPRFRPDGKQVAYKHQGGGFDSLWIVDTDGSNRKQLMTSDKDGANAPSTLAWSPDGRWLVVYRFDWKTDIPGVENKKKMHVPGYNNDRLEIIAPDGTSRGVVKLEGVTRTIWIEHPEWN